MAIGAVALSLPVALLGSVLVSVLNGLDLWQCFAAYSIVGFITLLLIVTASAIEPAVRDSRAGKVQTRQTRA